VVVVVEPAVALPALRSPSCTENSISELFMSAIRFGTPVRARVSGVGQVAPEPDRVLERLVVLLPSSPVATLAARATAAKAARIRPALCLASSFLLVGAGRPAGVTATLRTVSGPVGAIR
jgi:hypothetical protein